MMYFVSFQNISKCRQIRIYKKFVKISTDFLVSIYIYIYIYRRIYTHFFIFIVKIPLESLHLSQYNSKKFRSAAFSFLSLGMSWEIVPYPGERSQHWILNDSASPEMVVEMYFNFFPFL